MGESIWRADRVAGLPVTQEVSDTMSRYSRFFTVCGTVTVLWYKRFDPHPGDDMIWFERGGRERPP